MAKEITIKFEGDQGSGKTTCIDDIVTWLEDLGYLIVLRDEEGHKIVVAPPARKG